MKKFLLVFLIIAIVPALNMPEGFLARLGVDSSILMAATIAIVFAGFMQHLNLALIVLITIMAVAANVSDEAASAIGYDPDLVLVGLIALVLMPFIARQL